MVVDTDDYVGAPNAPEKEHVAIINPDGGVEHEADQLQDLPLANDCVYPPSHRETIYRSYKLYNSIHLLPSYLERTMTLTRLFAIL